MRILIVDDNDVKRKYIISVLINNKITDIKNITECTNIIDTKREMRENQFDVLLLDMQLPQRDIDSAKSKAGLEFFKDIKQDRRYNQPREVIGITAFEQELNEVKDDFYENLLHIIYYNEGNTAWENQLVERLEYIIACERNINEYNYDLGIICALDNPEFEAIKRLSTNWVRINKENTSLPFYETTFHFEKKDLKVIAISIDKMGMVPTAVLSTQMIEMFRPKYLAMTGIAAGVEGNVALGDILVVNPSWDSGAGKMKLDNDGNKLFEIDPRQETINGDINLNILELSKDTAFLNELRENWSAKKINNVLNVHIGPVACGAAVIADSEITNKIKLQSRKLIGIEMEAYGLIYAAKHATNPKPEPLVIKSVCDFADEAKNDGFQSYAAYTSAKFLYEFAKRYIN